MLLDAPTGSGKSYTVTQFLCSQAQQSAHFRAFFVSDQKKNLRIENFRKIWRQIASTEQPSDKRKIAQLRSLNDTIRALLASYDQQQIPQQLLQDKSVEEAFIFLKAQFRTYQLAQKINSDADNWRVLIEPEWRLRQAIAQRLGQLAGITEFSPKSDMDQEQIRRYLALHETVLSNWISDIYPTIALASYQLIILTTDKFIRGYTPFFQRSGKSFLFSSILTNSLVVFDEFDSTKARLWHKYCQEAFPVKTDLINLFGAIDHGFNRIDRAIPEHLKQLITQQPRYAELAAIAQKLKKQFKLSYLYKLETQVTTPNFVIHTPLDTMISDYPYWHSHYSASERRVIISHNVPDDLQFRKMLSSVAGFIRSFNRFVFNCAQRYCNQRNACLPALSVAMELDSAVWTLYHALGLADSQIQILVTLEAQIKRPVKSKLSQSTVTGDYEFQRRGVYLYHFQDSPQHELQTIINAAFFAVTPEQFLLGLLKKYHVWGLSATANLPTVLHNYDLTYLTERLGANLIQGRPLLTPATKQDFDYVTRYRQQDIHVEAQVVGGHNTIEQLVREYWQVGELTKAPDWQVIQSLDSQLLEVVNRACETKRRGQHSKSFYLDRYLDLFESFILFLSRPALVTFLGLQTPLPGKNDQMSQKWIDCVFTTLRKQLSLSVNDCQLRIISNTQRQVTEQLTAALQLPSQHTRVYLLSAYNSLGIGQNLQHPLTTLDTLKRCIAPSTVDKHDSRLAEKDLDGMYLGDVTHLLTQVDSLKLTPEMLHWVTELMYLLDANELNHREVQTIFNNMRNNQFFIRNRSKLPSLTASYSRVIIQALGRMNRTFNKSGHPLILASQSVLQGIGSMGMDSRNFSPEFQALLALSETPSEPEADDYKRYATLCNNRTAYCARDINQLVSGLRTDTPMAKNYQQLRELLLRNPTINATTLVKYQSQLRRGLQYLPQRIAVTSYQVGILNLQYGDYTFEKHTDPQLTVSAAASGLPSLLNYPGMKDYFQHNGYACSWISRDYILNPVQFVNLYLGILGEVGGRFIVEDLLGISLEPLHQLINNELFDFQVVASSVLIDFKNWRPSHQESALAARKHVEGKLDQLAANTGKNWRVAIINVIGEETHINRTNDNRIMEVSALINEAGQVVLSQYDQRKLGDFLLENQRDSD